MKKKFITAVLAVVVFGTASAQQKTEPPKPPKPPAPVVVAPPPEPPPPPPPPAPPIVPVEQLELLPKDYQAFLKRNPSVGSLRWNDENVWVMLKDGKEERYPLTEAGIKEVEAKYGKLPVPPPPPPLLPKMRTQKKS